jgi:ankyrin repeat protein
VDVNSRFPNGDTTLIRASERDYDEVNRELAKDERVDVNAQNCDGYTAFAMARKNGYHYDTILIHDLAQ